MMSEFSNGWFAAALDASVKALLLVAIASILISLLRVRDSNLKHRVFSVVLLGMLLLPAASMVLPAYLLPVSDFGLARRNPFAGKALSSSAPADNVQAGNGVGPKADSRAQVIAAYGMGKSLQDAEASSGGKASVSSKFSSDNPSGAVHGIEQANHSPNMANARSDATPASGQASLGFLAQALLFI